MSLINKMLQDLDARQAAGSERIASNHVRPLPPASEHRASRSRVIAVAAIIALAVAGSLYFASSRNDPPSAPGHNFKQGVLAPPASAPIASVEPATPPVAAEEKAPPATAPVAPWTGSPAFAEMPLASSLASIGRPEAFGLKVTTELAVPLAPRPRDDLQAAGAPPAPAVVVAPPMPAAAKARTGEGPTRIDKQNRAFTAQERAANDYREAVRLLDEGRAGAAMDRLRAALAADAALEEARLLLSSLLLRNRQLDEARAILQVGLAANPALPRLAMTLARIQVEMGDSEAAAGTLSGSAQAAAGNADYRGFQAAVLQRLGRHPEAVAEFRAALRLRPDSGLWWMGLGISLEAEGQKEPARDALRRARETGRLTPELDRFVQQKLLALAAPP